MTFIEHAIDRARTVVFLLVFILITGLQTYISIPKESAPDVKIPIIMVHYHHEGISPEDGERLIIRVIEQKVRSIEGVKEVRSTARQSAGTITLEFVAGFDSTQALDDVRAKVDEAKADLPADTDEPTVKEVSFSQFPVIVVHLSGALPQRALFNIAKDLGDSIEQNISSVLEAKVVGDREEAVEILAHPNKFEKLNISFSQMVQLFQNNNALVSAGVLDNTQGRFPIKINGLMVDVTDMLNTPVMVKDDVIVRFKDVAEIRRTYKDPEGFARLNGRSSVALEISKRTGENIIETIDAVQNLIQEESQYWPENLLIDYSQDESTNIKDMLGDLENNVIAAVLLVMLVIVVSLGWRSALLVGVAVPGSFLMGVLFIALQGHTVNIVVLFSLILSVGMLVDGAIIVAEYADQRMQAGVKPKQAYIEAAERMTWPVITSIITIIVAFAPLLFWPGIVGQFMKFLPLTLIATLTGSILMALVFMPTLGALVGKPQNQKENSYLTADDKTQQDPKQTSSESTSGPIKQSRYIQIYGRFLQKALNHPGKVISLIMAGVLTTFFLYGFFNHGTQFFPSIEPDVAAIHVRARGNLSVTEKDNLVKQVENRILDMDEFKNVYTNTVVGSSNSKGANPPPEDTIGTITVEFVNWQKRRKASAILQDVFKKTADIPGIIVQINEQEAGPPTGKPLHLEFSSRALDRLIPAVDRVRDYVDTVDGLISIEDTRPIPGFEWFIRVDRERAALFGSDIQSVGQGIRLISNGIRLDTFRPDDSRDEIDILLRFPPEYRNLKQLELLNIQSAKGVVPVSSFTEQGFRPKLDVINRVDGKRVYEITADLAPDYFAPAIVNQVSKWLKSNPQDPNVQIRFKGEDTDTKETSEFLSQAFLVALFLILIILVTQFNSFFSAFLVLSAVFLSTVGVLGGLMLTGRPFGIVMGGIGVIALGGIIVSNNIIFIDTFDQLKKTSKDIKASILETGLTRIRPVLLTQITTVLGLVPMALKLNIDFFNGVITYDAPSSQWWVDLSTAIVFGVSFATVLTLIVTPCALMLKENISQSLRENSIFERAHALLRRFGKP